MSDSEKTELKAVEAGLLAFIASFGRDFNAACTRQNLLFLSNSWAAFVRCSDQTTEYWRARFPEWSYMITQFHAFVNERAIADMAAAHTQPHSNWYNDTVSHSAPPRTVNAPLLD
jgi:type II secretory pathway component PulM